jgi:hypothetical protein
MRAGLEKRVVFYCVFLCTAAFPVVMGCTINLQHLEIRPHSSRGIYSYSFRMGH